MGFIFSIISAFFTDNMSCMIHWFSKEIKEKPQTGKILLCVKNQIAQYKVITLFAIILLLFSIDLIAQRFPKPEFESGYEQLETQIPAPRSNTMEYVDIFVLIAALSIVTWFVLRKRSRIGVFWVSIFSLLYFGFYREGCVCSVGALQNVTLALFNPGYKIPITVLAFFIIPLLYSLLFGRTFCAGVCPLGAIQDVFVIAPLKINTWVQKLLGLIPYLYLGLAILYAATDTDFIICRYDPFVGIYRLNAEFSMFLLGGLFLATSVIIARPYCRFFCPYGVLLNWMSRISIFHMTITPTKCIQCKLCEDSCPFDAIDVPDTSKLIESKKTTKTRFIKLAIIIPLIVIAGVWIGYVIHERLAMVNPKVQLAIDIMEIEKNPEITSDPSYTASFEIEAFKSSGLSNEELFDEASQIISEFRIGSIFFGGFAGLIFGITLAGLSIFRFKKDYEPNKGNCLSCARCMDYCPVDDESQLIEKVE
jgi:NosR/NirI family transcriptional regulator, nitrous oxide reductase regulator